MNSDNNVKSNNSNTNTNRKVITAILVVTIVVILVVRIFKKIVVLVLRPADGVSASDDPQYHPYGPLMPRCL